MLTKPTTSHSESIIASKTNLDPVVVCACDDAYVMPLAVTLLSAAESLRLGSHLQILIMDGGVSDENKAMLKETLADHPITISWLLFDAGQLETFSVSHHVSHTAYYRLLLSDVLPSSIKKVIYLDSDLLVKGDLLELWERPMGDHALLAVPDVACPYLDARISMNNFRRSHPYLASWKPVPNYLELGMNENAEYFNSGVMVIDLQKWRDKNLSEKLVHCMDVNQDHIWCWDQYALNVVLHGQWEALPLQWNMGSHAFEFPSTEHSPVDKSAFELMINHPKVVHFTTEWKPWHFGIQHPYRSDFFQILDRTAWKDWRPKRPPFDWKKSWEQLMAGSIKRGRIAYLKMKSAWAS